jgi:hypothetical protein
MSSPTKMGLGLLGDPHITFRHRKFRWTFSATFPTQELKESFVKLNSRPTKEALGEIEENEINYLSAKTWIPGKASWHTIVTTHFNVNETDPATKSLLDVLRVAWETIDKKEPQEPGVGVLTLYDGCGVALETFTLDGLEVQEINFGELDHSSSEEVDLEVTWRYKAATYKSLTAAYQPVPCAISPFVLPSAPVSKADGQVEPLLGGEAETLPDVGELGRVDV